MSLDSLINGEKYGQLGLHGNIVQITIKVRWTSPWNSLGDIESFWQLDMDVSMDFIVKRVF
jgi:hypothetical protein